MIFRKRSIVYETLNQASEMNRQQDLSKIKVDAHDEIYQAQNNPKNRRKILLR